MKQCRELGIAPIKCENKEGCDNLKAIHIKINTVLYQNSGKYLDGALANVVYNQLVALGKELSDLEVPSKATPKKEELLAKLRGICKTLKEWCSYRLTEEDLQDVQKSLNFFLSQYIKEKPTEPVRIVEMLAESKRLYNLATSLPNGGAYRLKMDNFIKANSELFAQLEGLKINRYQSLN